MAEKSFQERLQGVQRDGNLKLSDLARWFDRPYATVRGWVENAIEPGGGPIDIQHANELLALLELFIKKKRGFPVPRLSPQKRIAYLADIRMRALP